MSMTPLSDQVAMESVVGPRAHAHMPAEMWPSGIAFGLLAQLAAACLHHKSEVAPNVHRALPRKSRHGTASPRPVFCRRVTNKTSLRCMFVTQEMAACLGLRDVSDSASLAQLTSTVQGSQGPAAPAAPSGQALHQDQQHAASALQPPLSKVLFQRMLTMRDPAGQVWPVMYEAVFTAGQYHPRLANGWSAFCRHHQVRPGETVEFRRCARGNPDAMTARVIRRGRGA